METNGKKESEKTEGAQSENKNNTNAENKKEDKSWWENIAKDNPQLGAILKTLSNPLISVGSLAGVFYLMYANNKEKEKYEETLNGFKEEVKTKYNDLTEEYEKLKKKNKKLKKKVFGGEGKVSPVHDILNGTAPVKNPLYKTSFLD